MFHYIATMITIMDWCVMFGLQKKNVSVLLWQTLPRANRLYEVKTIIKILQYKVHQHFEVYKKIYSPWMHYNKFKFFKKIFMHLAKGVLYVYPWGVQRKAECLQLCNVCNDLQMWLKYKFIYSKDHYCIHLIAAILIYI